MVSRMFFDRRGGFPLLSALFLLSCVIVTLPTAMDPVFYRVFGGEPSPTYVWQYVTHNFEHGPVDPIGAHLLGNALAIVVFGVLAERVLGRARFLLLTITVLAVHTVFLAVSHRYGNGASGITCVYPPIALVVMGRILRTRGRKALKDWAFWVVGAMLALMLAVYLSRSLEQNLTHINATVVGFLFAFVWRQRIRERTDGMIAGADVPPGGPASSVNKIIGVSTVLVPAGLSLIVMLTLTGVLQRHVWPAELGVTPASGSASSLSAAGNTVLMEFPWAVQESFDVHWGISFDDSNGPLDYDISQVRANAWRISFSRALLPGESVDITIRNVKGADGRVMEKEIALADR